MSDTNLEMHTPEGYKPASPSHNGLILAILIMVLVLIFGGLYLWGSMLAKDATLNEETPVAIEEEKEMPEENVTAEAPDTMSSSDEIAAIEADITNSDFDSLSSDMDTVDAETNVIFAQ